MKNIISKLTYLFIAMFIAFAMLTLQSFTNNVQDDSPAELRHIKALEETLLMTNLEKERENLSLSQKAEEYLSTAKKPEEIAAVVKLKLIRNQTMMLRQQIAMFRKKVIDETGGYMFNDPRQQYVGAKEVEKVETLTIGNPGNKDGFAYSLQIGLNKYVDEINSALPAGERKFLYLAPEPANDLGITDMSQKTKDYPTYHFKNIPMVMVMAELAKIEVSVLNYEKRWLKLYADKLADVKVSNPVSIIIVPYSKVVTAGTQYDAEIFVTGTAAVPVFTCNGTKVPVDPSTKKGKISFVAVSNSTEAVEQLQYRYTVSFKANGKDTTFVGQENYFVKKPVIKISSVARNILYKGCGNEMAIDVPELGESYSPTFTAQGAELIKGAEKGAVTIVPNFNNVELMISSKGNFIGSEKFRVVNPPLPSIQLFNGGKNMDEKQGESISLLKSVTVKAVADSTFRSFYPKDSRYRIAEWQCTLVRGKRPVKVSVYTTETVDLSELLTLASPGDRLVIEFSKVIRTNFMNKTEAVDLRNNIVNIPLF